MAWSIVDSGGVSTVTTGLVTFTPNVAVNADDLMVIMACTNPATTTPSTPTGWTVGPVENVSASMRSWAFWKWAAGTENGVAQAWTGSQWTTSANKAMAWVIIRGVDKTEFNAMSDAERFAIDSWLSTTTEAVPTVTTDTAWKFGHVSLWNERSSTESTASDLIAPSGYTLTSDITFRTGSGICQAAVAWPTSLAEETDGSVGSGSWTNLGAGGITLLTVAFPTGVAATTVAGGTPNVTLTALAGTVSAGGAVTVAATGKPNITLTAPKGTPAPVSANVVSAISYPAIAAHRGGMGVKPQNTMAAFSYASGLSSAVALEMDVQVNASGSLVLWHDDDVSAVGVNSSGVAQSGLVTAKTDTDWNNLYVKWPAGFTGPPPEHAAYWREVVATYRNSGRVLLPEIKATAAGPGLVASIVANSMQGQCIVQSFDNSDLPQVVAAGIPAMLLDNTPNYTQMVTDGIGHVGIDQSFVTGTLCTNAHAVGIKVWTYTPNTVADRDALLALGVDGFITNKPATLLPNFVDGETPNIAVTALAGTVATGATVAGGVSSLTVSALAGSLSTGVTVAGGVASIATTALAGTVATGVTVAGGTSAVTVAALAGSVTANRVATVAGGTSSITVTANAGAVVTAGSVAVAGGTTAITVTAPQGAVAANRVADVAGGTAAVTLTAQPGTVEAQRAATVAGLPATLTLTAPSGEVVATRAATIDGLVASITLDAIAGTVQAIDGFLITPDDRTYTIRGETRQLTITAEDRTHRIPAEPRTLEVPSA